jgi:plasmid stabilization system protein ParE
VKPYRYHSEAETELLEQVSYYEAVSPRLGARFLAEVKAALALAGDFPKSGSPYYSRTRRVFPKGFPYS